MRITHVCTCVCLCVCLSVCVCAGAPVSLYACLSALPQTLTLNPNPKQWPCLAVPVSLLHACINTECMHTHVHTQRHTHTRTHAHMHTHTHTHMHTRMHARTHVRTCTPAHARDSASKLIIPVTHTHTQPILPDLVKQHSTAC